MKKFAIKAVAVATGALAAGGALAGSISAPATPTQFAVEALAPTTAITTPTIAYTMGVGRPAGNGFTIIMTPSAGSTLGTCVVPTYSVPAQVNATLKRQSATECAVDVQVVAPGTSVGGVWTWTGQTFASHPLANKGNSVSVSINLKDPGETAQVDNSGALTATIAQSVQSINVYAATSDTATVADVNAGGGPLTGFVATPFVALPDDDVTRAAAALTFDHNSVNAKAADGTTNYTFAGTVSLTLTGTTSGAATNGFCIDLNNNGTVCEVPERFTVTSSAASLANVVSGFGAQGTLLTRNVSFTANGTTQLGTSRTFAVSGVVTPTLAGTVPNALVDTAGKDATWWVWTANASQLMTPFFTLNSLFLTRYYFLNTGASPVGYSATCYSEGGAVIAYGAGKTGTLGANGMTTVNARDVCSFATGTPRGSIIFTINAPIDTVKGSYQYIDQVSLNGANTPMTRPYNRNNTTE